MKTMAIVLEQPEHIAFSSLDLTPPGDEDVVIDIEFSGISTGTEKLLFNGRMPTFPGMGYPLVPGYESVGVVVAAGPGAHHAVGERVFVPGARCASRSQTTVSVQPAATFRRASRRPSTPWPTIRSGATGCSRLPPPDTAW